MGQQWSRGAAGQRGEQEWLVAAGRGKAAMHEADAPAGTQRCVEGSAGSRFDAKGRLCLLRGSSRDRPSGPCALFTCPLVAPQ